MASADKLEKALETFDAEQTIDVMLRSMVYPKTKKVVCNDKQPVLKLTYHCDDNAGCDFRDALREIRENPELRAYATSAVLERLVSTIDQNQSPHRLDGFQFYRCGMNLLHLQRVHDDGKSCTEGRTGIMEYNDMRADLYRRVTREELFRTLRRWPFSWFSLNSFIAF